MSAYPTLTTVVACSYRCGSVVSVVDFFRMPIRPDLLLLPAVGDVFSPGLISVLHYINIGLSHSWTIARSLHHNQSNQSTSVSAYPTLTTVVACSYRCGSVVSVVDFFRMPIRPDLLLLPAVGDVFSPGLISVLHYINIGLSHSWTTARSLHHNQSNQSA